MPSQSEIMCYWTSQFSLRVSGHSPVAPSAHKSSKTASPKSCMRFLRFLNALSESLRFYRNLFVFPSLPEDCTDTWTAKKLQLAASKAPESNLINFFSKKLISRLKTCLWLLSHQQKKSSAHLHSSNQLSLIEPCNLHLHSSLTTPLGKLIDTLSESKFASVWKSVFYLLFLLLHLCG